MPNDRVIVNDDLESVQESCRDLQHTALRAGRPSKSFTAGTLVGTCKIVSLDLENTKSS